MLYRVGKNVSTAMLYLTAMLTFCNVKSRPNFSESSIEKFVSALVSEISELQAYSVGPRNQITRTEIHDQNVKNHDPKMSRE